jgi:hypothetical protein
LRITVTTFGLEIKGIDTLEGNLSQTNARVIC